MVTEDQRARWSWPGHLKPGAVRFSYASSRYDATIAFYRDVVGLPVITEFSGSFGEDGTVFGLPSIQAHLEIVRARAAAPDVSPLDQLVFYLSGPDAAAAAAAPLRAAGAQPDPAPHPYWAARGAIIYLDPDGRRVVFAPWVFGMEPEPGDAAGHA
jgi:catechol 2,3-dioxygenase-like lactoylglutathione lyase family enzyme